MEIRTTNQAHSDEIIHLLNHAHTLVAAGETSLQISCANIETQATTATSDCFQTFHPLFLACLAGQGVKDLYIETCDTCSNSSINVAIQAYETLNQAMAVKLIVHQGLKPEAQIKPIQENEPARRAFFKNFIPTVAKHAANTVEQVLADNKEYADIQQVLDQDKRNLPQLSKLFLHVLPQLNINHIPVPYLEDSPLGSIQASEACTACGDCVDVCPSQALNLKPFGQRFILEFQADCCTGCQQCVTGCPEQAIELLPSISLPSLLQQKARPLVMTQPR